MLYLAEGAGKHSKPDKRRYYLTARGSSTESAALLDGCLRLKLLDEAGPRTGKEVLVRIVSMLIKLAQSGLCPWLSAGRCGIQSQNNELINSGITAALPADGLVLASHSLRSL